MAKILVVDDEPDMIWAITNVLLSENHSVISVNSGEEALKKVHENAVDLVLLDFRLPGMDGIQILEKIKQMKPDLPVVMVTGYGGIEEAIQSIKLGALHYIQKPFDNDHLLDIVNKSLHIDGLKKEGVFGRRMVEKIEPQSLPRERSAPSSKEKPAKKHLALWLAISSLLLALAAGAVFYSAYDSSRSREYQIANSHVSGLSWGGGSLWISDWFTQSVHQYQMQGKILAHVKNFSLPGCHFTGITYADGSLYTCDSWKKKIYKHYPDNTLSIAATFNSPGPNPSGLYYDGKYLWSCDGTTRKIYQHALDDGLTLLAAYDSPGLVPVGLYHDKKNFWSASAVGMKIFKNSLQERFRLEKTFFIPGSFDIAQQISAFTMDDAGRIWATYEGVNKIYSTKITTLEEVTP